MCGVRRSGFWVRCLDVPSVLRRLKAGFALKVFEVGFVRGRLEGGVPRDASEAVSVRKRLGCVGSSLVSVCLFGLF